MHFSSSIIILVVICLATSLSYPDRKLRQQKRTARPYNFSWKMKHKKSVEDDCVGDFCEKVQTYPQNEIDYVLKATHLPIMKFYMKQIAQMRSMERSNNIPENLCAIVSRTLVPKRAKSMTTLKKEYIVQTENAQQSIYMEKCRSYKPRLHIDCLPDGYTAIECVQQYREIPLLSYDETARNIVSYSYAIPSGCAAEYKRMAFTPVPFNFN